MDCRQKIAEVRQELDTIDNQMLELFEKRMGFIDQVAEIKRAGNIAITDEAREMNMVERAVGLVKPEYKGETISFIRGLMALAKLRQRMQLFDQMEEMLLPEARPAEKENINIAYQGLPGAWGEQAAIQLYPNTPKTGMDKFEDVFIAVKEKRARYGILPLENSRTGAIGEVYELLRKYGCYIVGQTWVNVHHCLMGLPGTDIRDIREVFSHPEGFRQCGNYLKERSWDLIACRNTAVAASMVMGRNDRRFGAIGSPRSAQLNNLEVIKSDIMDDSENKTRFIAIADAPEYDESSDIVSITFRTSHRSGALCDVLFSLMAENINLTRIESQPMLGGKYCFFADLEGNIMDETVARGIRQAAAASGYLEVLGCYKENLED